MARKRLGELLLERRAITQEQLAAALALQRQVGGRLGNALVAKGYLSEGALCRTLGEALGLPVLATVGVKDWPALHLLRASFCERHELFPVALDDSRSGRRQLTVAMADPLDLPAIEQIEFTTGCKVSPALAARSQIRSAILHFYHRKAPTGLDKPHQSGRMTLVRAGGEEIEVDTKVRRQAPAPPPLPRAEEPEEIVPLTEEVTSRTELSELIRAREKVKRSKAKAGGDTLNDDLAFLTGTEDPQAAQIEELERRFWALMRLMAKKGLITKEEFKDEFEE
ncbi:MAG: GspE/PulE/PilB domain-containing protein [Myxococcales bacterium]